MFDVLYLNHYIIKSQEDFERKRERGRVYERSRPNGESARPWSFFHLINNVSTDDCGYLQTIS